MCSAHVKRFRTHQSSFSAFWIGEEFFVGHQMPHANRFMLFNGNDSQQSEATLELKDQIIARRKRCVHFKSPAAQINREPVSAVSEIRCQTWNCETTIQP